MPDKNSDFFLERLIYGKCSIIQTYLFRYIINWIDVALGITISLESVKLSPGVQISY